MGSDKKNWIEININAFFTISGIILAVAIFIFLFSITQASWHYSIVDPWWIQPSAATTKP